MKNKSCIDILEDLAINMEKLEDNFILMKEQFIEFRDADKTKINFKECHVAICPNGGLIAICKKKGFLDITKGTKLNSYIIIMHQDAKRKYLIPIDWSYKDKWVIDLEFNEKEQLYAICNDGTIFKFDILNLKAEQKVSCEIFKNEAIVKCKLFEKGFIALTIEGNFFYVSDIKNPSPELFFPMKSLLDFSNNVDFLLIPKNKSKSRKLELLITNDNGNGVIHIEKSEEGRFGIKPVEGKSNEISYKNVRILKKDKLEIFIKENNKSSKHDINDENMGKIVSLAMSPSKTKIALYDNRGFVYFFSSDLNFESKVLFKINEDFSESEINEQKSIINFNVGYQFLFCGEDAVALSGQRFIFVINQNEMQNTYKIIEGYEMDAIQGTLFSKCISEIDGLRYLTNDGVFFISNISNDFYDICNPFSNSPSKKLLKAYLDSLNKLTNSELSIREISNFLTSAINSLQTAAGNIFWVCDYSKTDTNNSSLSSFEISNIEKKNSQLFVLEAAQHGKHFVKSEIFNYDKFLEICKDIRIVNNLRNHESKPKFITFNEYKNLDPEDLLNKVMRNLNFGMAFEICRFLDYNEKNIYQKYAIACAKRLKHSFDTSEEIKLFDILQGKLRKCPDLSYIELAKKAFKYNKKTIGLKFLENEKSKLTKIPQYIELKDWDTAINLAESLHDSNAIVVVLDKMMKRENFNNFLEIASRHPESKSAVIDFLKISDPEQIEGYFKIIKNPEELFFYYLEQYFQSPIISKRKRIINLARESEKLITNAINPNFEHKFYRNYLENLENNLTFKIDIFHQEKEKDKFIIPKPEEKCFDISIYDTYKYGIRADKYNWIETQNKHFNFSTEGMSIMRCITYCEMGSINNIDFILKKVSNNVKKLGLTYLNLGEIYYKFEKYDKAAENIKMITESCYLDYKVEMLKNMKKYELALEAIISDKSSMNKRNMVNEILRNNPNLRQKAEELFVKYKTK